MYQLPEERVQRPPTDSRMMPPGVALAQSDPTGPRMQGQNTLIPANPVVSPRSAAPQGMPAPMPQQGGAAPTQPAMQPMSPAEREQAYRRAMRAEFPDMPEQDFEMHVQYGIAKQRGRIAATRSKELSKPMSKYLSTLAKKEAAELQYQQLGEKLKSKRAEFMLPDGRMDPGFAPYKDQLDAARLKVQKRRESLAQQRQLLNKLGVTDKDIENPVTIHEFMRSLAAAKPEQADTFEDDTDLMDNEE